MSLGREFHRFAVLLKKKFSLCCCLLNFFEVFKTVTSHLMMIGDDLETIAFVYFIDVMHDLLHLDDITPLSPLN